MAAAFRHTENSAKPVRKNQPEPEPEGRAGRVELLRSPEPGVILPLGRCEHVLVARGQTGGPGEPVQVRGVEWAFRIGQPQCAECVVPVTALITVAAAQQKGRARSSELVGRVGIEPATKRLRGNCIGIY